MGGIKSLRFGVLLFGPRPDDSSCFRLLARWPPAESVGQLIGLLVSPSLLAGGNRGRDGFRAAGDRSRSLQQP
jgi:hypothetical protein